MVDTEKDKKLYSDSVVGASYRFIATDLRDNKFVVIGS